MPEVRQEVQQGFELILPRSTTAGEVQRILGYYPEEARVNISVVDSYADTREDSAPEIINFPDWPLWINVGSRTINLCGIDIKTTNAGFDVLTYLARRADLVIPKQETFESIWGDRSKEFDSHVVDTQLSKLRSRIRELTGLKNKEQPVQTIKGIGHKFNSSPLS